MEIPLPPLDSCRLLAINLYSYVKNPFTKDAYFDIELFRKHVNVAQRMMDNIVDLELEKVDAIIQKIESDPEPEHIKRNELELWRGVYDMGKRGRRTGLGITAEGDMLAALNLRYGTKEATKFSEFVHKTLAIEAYKSSAIMAKERGAFEMYDADREANNPFLNRLKEESKDLELTIEKYGRRNISCLTIAPTGTTSLMTQTTSGIEPAFLPVYKRRRKVDKDSKNIAFIDVNGDAFEEYIVFHHKFKEWMLINGYDVDKNYSDSELEELISKSPYYKATANDVDWLEKVRMQGRIQKLVDHSISVTVNLPNSVDEELVSNVYETAWESGCKGCTIYRDGSRNGVLVSASSESKKDNEDKPDYKRPHKLNAEIIRFQNNKEKWIAFIGLKDGSPYEIFTGRASEIDVTSNVNKGFIVKEKDSNGTVYNFEYIKNGGVVVMHGLSRRFHPEYWNYAKLISGMLRHGMPIQYAIKTISSLTEKSESINSWKSGVSRALKRFVKDGTDAGATCESCGGSLVYQEGCLICVSCGASRCG